MASRRTGLLAVLGIVAATAGVGTAGPTAEAAVVASAVECVPPPLNGPKFTWQPQIELTVAPRKDTYAIGEQVTVTWNWKTPPRNPSSWSIIAQDSAQPSGVVKLTGAQTADVVVAGPRKNPMAWGSDPLHVEAMTGTFTVGNEGRIDLAPGSYTLRTWLIGDPSACTPTGTPAISTGLQVGTPPTPDPGDSSGGATGQASAGTSGTGGGTSAGGTSGGTTPPGGQTGTTGAPPTTGAPGTPGTPRPPGAPASGTPGTPPTAPPFSDPPPNGAAEVPIPGAPPALPSAGVPGPPPPIDPQPVPGGPPPAGPLFMTPSQEGVLIGDLPPGGGAVTGQLTPLTVTDQRGSTLGWTLTGQIGDFVAPDGSAIPGSAFAWTPDCAAVDDKASAVSDGLPGTAAANPELLCRQNPSMGEVTGGEFHVGASVRLDLTGPTGSAPYTAPLTLTLI